MEVQILSIAVPLFWLCKIQAEMRRQSGCLYSPTGVACDRSQVSITSVLMVNPIQNAIPKNWRGSRCVSRLVAKNTPMTGRVVAIPSRTAIARINHRRPCPNSPWRHSK
jgi:hypothetical protein